MLKQLLVCLIVFVAIFLYSGIPALISLIQGNQDIIADKPKTVMLSGIAFFLYYIGFMGFYFWTRTDYKHYRILFWVGTTFIFIATIGLQYLWNLGNS